MTKTALDFTQPHDLPVPYMRRLRDYYLALGYGNPYRWAQYAEVPFSKLRKPLIEMRVALVTTAGPLKPNAGDQGPGAAYNAAAKFYQVYSHACDEEMFLGISHLGYDRKYTTAEDIHTFFPLRALRKAAEENRIGELSPRFHGVPTNRSQVTTIEQDCADLLTLLREDEAEAVVLVLN